MAMRMYLWMLGAIWASTQPAQAAVVGVEVRKVSRSIGMLEDRTLYEVRGSSLAEIKRALSLIKIRDSASGAFNRVNEHDFSEDVSITLARPLSIPTGVVMKVSESYFGGGIFITTPVGIDNGRAS